MRFLLAISLILMQYSHAQVGINTTSPHASSLLDISSTSKGFLPPKLTNAQMNAVNSPTAGLVIYNTDASANYMYNGSNWNSLEDRISGFVDDGVALQLDNLKILLSTNTSERSLRIATVAGNISISGSSINYYPTSSVTTGGVTGTITGYVRQTDVFSTSYTTWYPGLNFTLHGSVQKLDLIDETNNHAYRCLLIIGHSFKNNFISLERIY
jgi:hypothetical protein